MTGGKSRPGKLKRILAIFGEEWLKNKLQEFYQKLLSMNKVAEELNKELEKHNIRIGKDFVHRVMDLYGIQKLSPGPRSEIIRKLGGEQSKRNTSNIIRETRDSKKSTESTTRRNKQS